MVVTAKIACVFFFLLFVVFFFFLNCGVICAVYCAFLRLITIYSKESNTTNHGVIVNVFQQGYSVIRFDYGAGNSTYANHIPTTIIFLFYLRTKHHNFDLSLVTFSVLERPRNLRYSNYKQLFPQPDNHFVLFFPLSQS